MIWWWRGIISYGTVPHSAVAKWMLNLGLQDSRFKILYYLGLTSNIVCKRIQLAHTMNILVTIISFRLNLDIAFRGLQRPLWPPSKPTCPSILALSYPWFIAFNTKLSTRLQVKVELVFLLLVGVNIITRNWILSACKVFLSELNCEFCPLTPVWCAVHL